MDPIFKLVKILLFWPEWPQQAQIVMHHPFLISWVQNPLVRGFATLLHFLGLPTSTFGPFWCLTAIIVVRVLPWMIETLLSCLIWHAVQSSCSCVANTSQREYLVKLQFTDVWGMGRLNMLKQHRNAVKAEEYVIAEDCTIWIDDIGYGQFYT